MSLSKEQIFREKKKISFYSIVLNAFLSLLKIAGGLISNSSALLADGIHSLSDLAASLSVYTGIVISNRKSKQFPYGLYKVENLVALISAMAIFFAGYEIGKDVLFSEPQPISSLYIALSIIVLNIVLTFFYARYERKMGEKLNSPSLIADSEHVKTDFFTALIVLTGIFAQYFDIIWLLKLAVIVVIGFIFHSGFEILKEAIRVLLDASIDPDTIEKIKNLLAKEAMIVKVNSITGRNSGSYKFVELDIVLATNSLEKAHKFSEQLKKKIIEQVEFVEDVTIHFEQGHKQVKIAVLTQENGEICAHFGGCPQIMLFTKTNKGFEKEILVNPAFKLQRRKGIELAEYLNHKKVTCVVTRNKPASKSVLYALENFFIDIVITEKNHVNELNLESLCK